jgi:hypothetical protein
MIGAVFGVLAANRTRWRRARNLRAGVRADARSGAGLASPVATGQAAAAAAAVNTAPRRALALPRLRLPGATVGLAVLALLFAAAGAWTIATHARWLAAAAEEAADAPNGRIAALQRLLPGASFDVPRAPGVHLQAHAGGTLLVLSGMRAEPVRRVDLCTQMADQAQGRLLPVRIGWRAAELARLPAAPRNPLVADMPMPHLEIAGNALGGAPLTLRWQGRQADWLGDADGRPLVGAQGQAAFQRQGWMLWDGASALRVLRRASASCPQAGELVLQLYRKDPAAGAAAVETRALVTAFAAASSITNTPVELRLAAGSYTVPAAAPAQLEDRQLFDGLREHGLVRLGRGGLAELAPPDLAGWRAAGPTPWDDAVLDAEGLRLLQHLYGRADGEFVRAQLRIFNGERRLLAWRLRAADVRPGADSWRAETGGVPAWPTTCRPPVPACSRACRRAGRRGSGLPPGRPATRPACACPW